MPLLRLHAACSPRLGGLIHVFGLLQHDRSGALAAFTAGKVSVLVATDVASRGLDIKGIAHVVNADLPKTFEDYVHRIGAPAASLIPCVRLRCTAHSVHVCLWCPASVH